jgi:DNA-binding MarR family transcriptional regulator
VPLDPLIHQQNRLQIMATLYRNRQMAFTELRDACGLTTGNAGSHLGKLEEAGYIRSGRLLRDLTFELHYRITAEGVAAFQAYLRELQDLIAQGGAPGGEA